MKQLQRNPTEILEWLKTKSISYIEKFAHMKKVDLSSLNLAIAKKNHVKIHYIIEETTRDLARFTAEVSIAKFIDYLQETQKEKETAEYLSKLYIICNNSIAETDELLKGVNTNSFRLYAADIFVVTKYFMMDAVRCMLETADEDILSLDDFYKHYKELMPLVCDKIRDTCVDFAKEGKTMAINETPITLAIALLSISSIK